MKASKKLFIKILNNYGDIINADTLKELQRITNGKDTEEIKMAKLERRAKHLHAQKIDSIINMFIDMLDSTFEPVEIAGTKYPYSVVYERVDPVAYEMELNDFINYMLDDLEEF